MTIAQKSGCFTFFDYTLALLPQKFSTNNHTTKKGNKEEVEPNLLALLSVKRELFFSTASASVTLNRDDYLYDSRKGTHKYNINNCSSIHKIIYCFQDDIL